MQSWRQGSSCSTSAHPILLADRTSPSCAIKYRCPPTIGRRARYACRRRRRWDVGTKASHLRTTSSHRWSADIRSPKMWVFNFVDENGKKKVRTKMYAADCFGVGIGKKKETRKQN